MKKLFFIAGFMVVGLFLEVGVSFAAFSDDWAKQGQAILENLHKYENEPESKSGELKPTGPTREDIMAATKVENLAAKGSLEDKLISAVKDGNLKNVETFIAAGAGLETRDNKNMTALMIAAKEGYTDIVKILIDAGANANAKDKFGCTALFKAADKGHAEIVKLLIANGAAKNEKNFSDLFVSAASRGNNEMVKAFLVAGAHIDHDTLDTAYFLARIKCSAEIANAIKELQKKLDS